MTSRSAIDRRTLLRRGAACLAGATLASNVTELLAGEAHRWFKIGACEWSLGKEGPACFEVAKTIGLDGLQLDIGSVEGGLHLRRPDIQAAYKRASRQSGVAIASLALTPISEFGLASEPRSAVWLLDSLDVAEALGVKVILLAFFWHAELNMDDTANIRRLVDVLKEVCPRAEKAGLVLGLENYLTAEENIRIMDRVGSPALQVYYDVGNSTDKGYDILKEIRLLGHKRICEFHAKDGGQLLGKGRIDFRAVRKAIDDIGYSGWLQIEGQTPNDLISDYKTDLAYLRGLFPPQV